MAIDTPARIAILGGGPIGLEAALYARYLGYDVDVFERGRVAENLLRWGHVRLFSPWRMNVSPLGMAALAAQSPGWRPPDGEALLSGREMVDAYFQPLAESDLVADTLHTATEVLAIGRDGLLKGDLVGREERSEVDFRLLVRDPTGSERIVTADAVIDATGTYGCHNWAGSGGVPAPGERSAVDKIEYGLPDILGEDRHVYAGSHVLLVGSGYSAATSAVAIAELAALAPGTRATWITRTTPDAAREVPIETIALDRLGERDRLAQWANALAVAARATTNGTKTDGPITWWPGTLLDSIRGPAVDGKLCVRLSGVHAGELTVDRVIANVGYRPQSSLYAELQVHECYASAGPMKLAVALLGHASADCLDQPDTGPGSLINPEPDFYILGVKSYGRGSRFLLSVGLTQIREVFSIIADRADLDLYATMALPRS